MKQYVVYYSDKTSEPVEAYGYNLCGGRATFDMGRQCDKLILLRVVRVELVG